jgi:hypothetical protein
MPYPLMRVHSHHGLVLALAHETVLFERVHSSAFAFFRADTVLI